MENEKEELPQNDVPDKTDEEIKELVEKRLAKMKEEDVAKDGKQYKIRFISIFIMMLTLSVVGIVVSTTVLIVGGFNAPWPAGYVLAIIFTICAFVVVKPKMFKWDYRQWLSQKIYLEIKNEKKQAVVKRGPAEALDSLHGKKIKYTSIIDSYTEYTDKLHAVLNYQEIIQHRIYKFLVTFEDDSTKIETAEENTQLYHKLTRFLVNPKVTTNEAKEISTADELLKYKKLLDDGAITEEEYQDKKNKLLNK